MKPDAMTDPAWMDDFRNGRLAARTAGVYPGARPPGRGPRPDPVERVVVDPDTDDIYALTKSGLIWRSRDGGLTFERAVGRMGSVRPLEVSPLTGDILETRLKVLR